MTIFVFKRLMSPSILVERVSGVDRVSGKNENKLDFYKVRCVLILDRGNKNLKIHQRSLVVQIDNIFSFLLLTKLNSLNLT